MSAETQVSARLSEIEAGVADLRTSVFGWHKARDLAAGTPAAQRYRNRLLHVLLLLYHLEADVNRLAKRRGKDRRVVKDFVESSSCVRVCWRVANSHKHGLGGSAANATLPNAAILVVKDPSEAPSPGDADATIAGMIVSDADEGSFTSQALLECAVREWVTFLQSEFDLNHSDWLERCFPKPQGPVVPLRPDGNNVVPMNSVVTLEVPEHIRSALIDDMKRRREKVLSHRRSPSNMRLLLQRKLRGIFFNTSR